MRETLKALALICAGLAVLPRVVPFYVASQFIGGTAR
jgi:hypothetical protein